MKLLTPLTFWVAVASAHEGLSPYVAGTDCCAALDATDKLHTRILYPYSTGYRDREGSYFSDLTRLAPACIFQPQDVTEVSAAVKVLVVQDCQFAVRSGGHMHIPGSNNINGGVTIDFGAMNGTVYHAENSTAAVGPGATWGSVYQALDAQGVMVAGGRASSVGVGGLILGGGNSFYAGKRGMVCDNVARFEVVLGNGTIVTASKDENADLFQVLKGGGNNFGIVTRYDVMAFEGGDFWGGIVVYPAAVGVPMMQAFNEFAATTEQDDAASAIVMDAYELIRGAQLFVNSYEYTAPVSRPAAFDPFYAINASVADTTRITNMTDLVTKLDQPAGLRAAFATLTFKNDVRVLQKAHKMFSEMVATLLGQAEEGKE